MWLRRRTGASARLGKYQERPQSANLASAPGVSRCLAAFRAGSELPSALICGCCASCTRINSTWSTSTRPSTGRSSLWRFSRHALHRPDGACETACLGAFQGLVSSRYPPCPRCPQHTALAPAPSSVATVSVLPQRDGTKAQQLGHNNGALRLICVPLARIFKYPPRRDTDSPPQFHRCCSNRPLRRGSGVSRPVLPPVPFRRRGRGAR